MKTCGAISHGTDRLSQAPRTICSANFCSQPESSALHCTGSGAVGAGEELVADGEKGELPGSVVEFAVVTRVGDGLGGGFVGEVVNVSVCRWLWELSEPAVKLGTESIRLRMPAGGRRTCVSLSCNSHRRHI